MTTLTMLHKGQQIIGFRCEGHSGYADEGEDIVCAAISSMTQFCLCYAEQYGIKLAYRKDDGLLECSLIKFDNEFSKLLKVLETSVSDLAQVYPDNIQLQIMEV